MSKPILMTVGGLVLMLLATQATLAQGEVERWQQKFYNPKPNSDDLVLPMPCGGAMAFRPIAVAAENLLSDQEVRLGDSRQELAYAEGTRAAHISGGFTHPKQMQRRVYFLAKYETTRDQWQALQGDCPGKPSLIGRKPITKVSWAETVASANDYTLWLLEHAAHLLPRENGTPGFLRLPTEVEWEYAARGGLAVTSTLFQEPVFPMSEGINRYVWFAGTGSSKGREQPIGLKLPNPLGLYDILGNVDEIVLEPFRLNRLHRLHGQPGGFTVKGGNFLTAQGEIRSAYRQEVPHFDDNGTRRVRTVGVRFAISTRLLTSRERLETLRREWNALAASEPQPLVGEPLQDPVEELDAIIAATRDKTMRRRLEGFSLVLKTNIERRNRQRNLAARNFIRLGAYIAQKLSEDLKRIDIKKKSLATLEKVDAKADIIEQTRSGLKSSKNSLNYNLAYFTDLVIEVSRSYPDVILNAERATLTVDFEEKNLNQLLAFAEKFVETVTSFRHEKRIDRDAILRGVQR